MTRAKPSVLIVDDQPLVCQLVARMLVKAGFDAQVANDASEAIRCAETKSFEIVIADWKMPGMDGAELIACLLARSLVESAILMSGCPVDDLAASIPAWGSSSAEAIRAARTVIPRAQPGSSSPGKLTCLTTKVRAQSMPKRTFNCRTWKMTVR